MSEKKNLFYFFWFPVVIVEAGFVCEQENENRIGRFGGCCEWEGVEWGC